MQPKLEQVKESKEKQTQDCMTEKWERFDETKGDNMGNKGQSPLIPHTYPIFEPWHYWGVLSLITQMGKIKLYLNSSDDE